MADRKFIEAWVKDILETREDKSWTPNLFADKVTAEYLVNVNGLPVGIDETLKPRTIIIRCNPDELHEPKPPMFGKDTGVRAIFTGVDPSTGSSGNPAEA